MPMRSLTAKHIIPLERSLLRAGSTALLPAHLIFVGALGIAAWACWTARPPEIVLSSVAVAAVALLVAAASLLCVRRRLLHARDRLQREMRLRRDGIRRLRESEERFREFTDIASDWVWEMGPDLCFTYVSERVREFTGVDSAFFLGQRREDYTEPAVDAETHERQLAAVRAHRPFQHFDFCLRLPEGRRCYVRVSGRPRVHPSDGHFLGYRGVGTDVTAEYEAAAAIKASQQQLVDAIETLSEGFVLYDKDDRLILCNQRYREAYPKSADLLIPGARFEDILRAGAERGEYAAAVGRVEEWVAERLRRHRACGEATEQQLTDGRWLHIKEYRTSTGGIGGLRVDITERKRQEIMLMAQYLMLERVAAGGSLPSMLDDLIRWTEELCPEARGAVLLLDEQGHCLVPVSAPSLPKAYVEALNRVEIGRSEGSCGTAAFRKETVVVSDIAADPLWRNDRRLALSHGLRACWSVPILAHDGAVLGTFATYFGECRAPTSHEEQVVGTAVHLARLAIERHRKETVLAQAQKMEAIGQLTGGIAHDFNNLLTVVLANVHMLRGLVGADPNAAHMADLAQSAARRAADLTRRLLAFSRQQTLLPERVAVNELIRELEPLLRRTVDATIKLEVDLAAEVPPIVADRGQLENSILNLVINARDAMPAGGQLTIRTTQAYVTDGIVMVCDDGQHGSHALIDVTDTGTGMTPEVRRRVFEPFFTTKEVGKGTGLGLSMVYGFVRQSDGHIEIDSEVGRGTSVRIFLPRSEDVTAEGAQKPPADQIDPRGDETILLVDDDDLVRASTRTMLESLGYSVVEARDGPEALATLNDGSPVDLVLTDVVMPGGLNGWDLVKKARRRQPRLRALVTSGYANAIPGLEDGTEANRGFLPKPYEISGLARAVRRALDESATLPGEAVSAAS